MIKVVIYILYSTVIYYDAETVKYKYKGIDPFLI
jgi:hypothetical protein